MSGFDENPFGEPVFADPFKVSSKWFEIFFHIFSFSLCNPVILSWIIAVNHSYVGSLDSTSRPQHRQQQSEPRRLRSFLGQSAAYATSYTPVDANFASVFIIGSAVSSEWCHNKWRWQWSHTNQHRWITGESSRWRWKCEIVCCVLEFPFIDIFSWNIYAFDTDQELRVRGGFLSAIVHDDPTHQWLI